MIKKILVSAGVLFALLVVSAPAHAALVLDGQTTVMLSGTLSATQSLVSFVQGDINAGAYSPYRASQISLTLGYIGNILANISSMIGGVGLPNTGYPPAN